MGKKKAENKLSAEALEMLKAKLDARNLEKLLALKNPAMHRFVAEAVALCQPDSVFVCTDDPADIAYVRGQAVARKEETPLKTEGHTVHFDGFNDQGRDPGATKYLVPPGVVFSNRINHVGKEEGLVEVRERMKGTMKGRQALVRFFCLGPTESEFAISCVQVTDSFYVGHSEDLLYRQGYEQFRRLGDSPDFFRLLHSCGETVDGVSKHHDKKCIRIDLEENTVYSVNTQYAGNTVGLKKLSLRLSINKASREGWLSEHMLLMGVNGPKGRVTYLAGAFPSACGKTSTAMIPGERIVGDDLAFLRIMDGQCRAANVEHGIFGIIQDVKAASDPLIWDVLTKPGEVIFSNVLVSDGTPYWLGDGRTAPASGVNFSGPWQTGKKDAAGEEIPHAHKNARYTISLSKLGNYDAASDNPRGVALEGVIYGGRDSDTCVAVEEAFDWVHGTITKGATLESETTAAVIGKQGVRTFDLMSNLQFLSVPPGRYIAKHLDFGAKLKSPPRIFSVNYFLKGPDGKYLSGMLDKKVWVQWIERRLHGEVEVIQTPTGQIPLYADLAKLFRECRNEEFTKEKYVELFSVRCVKLLEKIERIMKIYKSETDVPDVVFKTLEAQGERIEALRATKGDVVSPLEL